METLVRQRAHDVDGQQFSSVVDALLRGGKVSRETANALRAMQHYRDMVAKAPEDAVDQAGLGKPAAGYSANAKALQWAVEQDAQRGCWHGRVMP